jgi:hypothetical protein
MPANLAHRPAESSHGSGKNFIIIVWSKNGIQ